MTVAPGGAGGGLEAPPQMLTSRPASALCSGAVQVGPISAACSSAPRMVVASIVPVGAGAGSSSGELHPAATTRAQTVLTTVRTALPVANIRPSLQTGPPG
jgi:hypothetical protein